MFLLDRKKVRLQLDEWKKLSKDPFRIPYMAIIKDNPTDTKNLS